MLMDKGGGGGRRLGDLGGSIHTLVYKSTSEVRTPLMRTPFLGPCQWCREVPLQRIRDWSNGLLLNDILPSHRWGYRLPEYANEKGVRWTYRSLTHGCLLSVRAFDVCMFPSVPVCVCVCVCVCVSYFHVCTCVFV